LSLAILQSKKSLESIAKSTEAPTVEKLTEEATTVMAPNVEAGDKVEVPKAKEAENQAIVWSSWTTQCQLVLNLMLNSTDYCR